jgi:peptidyl-prolyl cis-trans isomerase A (cyclophilin A)
MGIPRLSAWRVLVVVLILCAGMVEQSSATVLRIETSAGDIDVRFFDQSTPLSVANFLAYSDPGLYDGSFIHRRTALATSGVAVIQGGGFYLNNSIFAASAIPPFSPVLNEPGISNLRGTLAYAKGSDPNSATSQWFFNVLDNTVLDSPSNGEFTVFGRVINGTMSVVDAIYSLPLINASVAQNAPGEDFDEIPVFDAQKVINQNDILDEDAVVIQSIVLLSSLDGDYDFDEDVDGYDFLKWQRSFGSTIDVAADNNGNAIVGSEDLTAWKNGYGSVVASGASVLQVVPEPSSLAIASFAVFLSAHFFSRRHRP